MILGLLLSLALAGTPQAPPAGWVDLQALLPRARFEIGYARADNFTGAPLPGYEVAGAWLREAPAAALVRAAARLEVAGYQLVIFDAYRPVRASAAMVEWAHRTGQAHLLQGYIAPRSSHNRGLTVDVGLARDGALVDMGSPWDTFGPVSHLRGVTGEALERRLLLRQALLAEGFEPYDREWWHFQHRSEGASLDLPYGAEAPP